MSKVLYGVSQNAIGKMSEIIERYNPVCFCDIDEKKWNTRVGGLEVYSLEETLHKFPDSEFVITMKDIYIVRSAFSTLLNAGVSKNKIGFLESFEYRRGCDDIINQMHFFGNPTRVYFCCKYIPNDNSAEREKMLNKFTTNYERNDCEVWENQKNIRNHVLTNHINKCFDFRCEQCGSLRFDVYRNEPIISEFTFGSEEDYFCNFKCIYCGGCHIYKDNILPILQTIKTWEKEKLLTNNIMVSFAKGELFARKDCNDILDFVLNTKWNVGVLTNGSIYNDKIAQLVKQGRYVAFNCSLDAGTPETFYKIKGVDCFEKVVNNISKYRNDGVVIELKYIILDGINSNINDIEGFFKIADTLNANVVLAANNLKREIRLSSNAIESARTFVKMAINGRVSNIKAFVTSIMRNFNPDDAKILLETIEEELNK